MNSIKNQHARYFWLLLISAAILFYFAYVYRNSAYASLLITLAGTFAASLLILQKQLSKFGLLLISVGVGILFIEITLGLFVDSAPITRFEGDYASHDASKMYRSKTYLGRHPNPGIFTSRKFSSTGELMYDVAYTIDDDRTRVTPGNTDDLRQNPAGINFFGGSFTFGEGLNDNQTLPYYVSQLLHVPVKNYGVHGYGAHQAYHIMRNYKLNMENKINVFITPAFHSLRSFCISSSSRGTPKYLINHAEHGIAVIQDGVCKDPIFGEITPGLFEKLLTRFKLYALIKRAVIATKDRDGEFKLYLQLIKSMHDLSESQNKIFIVGYIERKQHFKGSNYSNQRIINSLKKYGIKVVNLSLAKNGKLSPKYYLHEEDHHPSAIANKIRAELLAAELTKALQLTDHYPLTHRHDMKF